MDKNILMSVIIPVYNAEKTLERCVNSILEQSISEELEVILINDGSTDASLKVCYCLAEKDKRVRILTGKNKGVSYARNKGIESARGKYLAFVDADDTVEYIYDKMKNYMQGAEYDVIVFDYNECRENQGKRQLHRFNDLAGKEVENRDIIKRLLWQLSGTCWQAVYKRDLINKNNIHFTVGMTICEDYQFILKCLIRSCKVKVYPECLYNYYISSCSTTGRYMPGLEKSIKYFTTWLKTLREEFPEDLDMEDAISNYCGTALMYMIFNVCKPETPYNYFERVKYAKKQAENNMYKDAINNCTQIKTKIPTLNYLQMLTIKYHMEWMDVVYYSYAKKILEKIEIWIYKCSHKK